MADFYYFGPPIVNQDPEWVQGLAFLFMVGAGTAVSMQAIGRDRMVQFYESCTVESATGLVKSGVEHSATLARTASSRSYKAIKSIAKASSRKRSVDQFAFPASSPRAHPYSTALVPVASPYAFPDFEEHQDLFYDPSKLQRLVIKDDKVATHRYAPPSPSLNHHLRYVHGPGCDSRLLISVLCRVTPTLKTQLGENAPAVHEVFPIVILAIVGVIVSIIAVRSTLRHTTASPSVDAPDVNAAVVSTEDVPPPCSSSPTLVSDAVSPAPTPIGIPAEETATTCPKDLLPSVTATPESLTIQVDDAPKDVEESPMLAVTGTGVAALNCPSVTEDVEVSARASNDAVFEERVDPEVQGNDDGLALSSSSSTQPIIVVASEPLFAPSSQDTSSAPSTLVDASENTGFEVSISSDIQDVDDASSPFSSSSSPQPVIDVAAGPLLSRSPSNTSAASSSTIAQVASSKVVSTVVLRGLKNP